MIPSQITEIENPIAFQAAITNLLFMTANHINCLYDKQTTYWQCMHTNMHHKLLCRLKFRLCGANYLRP